MSEDEKSASDIWAGDVVWTPEGTWIGGWFYSRQSPTRANLYDLRCELPIDWDGASGDDKTVETCRAKFDNIAEGLFTPGEAMARFSR